jgi:hypothetical protein
VIVERFGQLVVEEETVVELESLLLNSLSSTW